MSKKEKFIWFVVGFASCLVACAISVKTFIAKKQKEFNIKDLSKLGNMDELTKQARKVFSEIQRGNINISDEQLKSAMRRFPPVTGIPSPSKRKK